jgi:Cu+-exporting ATPase
MVQMVSEAQRSRAPLQRLADRVAEYFVPAVFLTSILTGIVWYFLGPAPQGANAWVNALSVLIIACPCALGLATPMAVLVGTGRAAQKGILFRNAEALEKLSEINALVVDKTGTLTEGKPEVVNVKLKGEFDLQGIVQLAASLASKSHHPLSSALISHARGLKISLLEVEGYSSVPGQGVQGMLGGAHIKMGSFSFVGSDESAELHSGTVVAISREGKLLGWFECKDRIRESAKAALKELDRKGIEVFLASGDQEKTVSAVAEELGIKNFRGKMSPEQKMQWVEKLQQQGRIVAMAGDGVNDGPALALAHVGIAMGSGTDVAMHSAGVTLVRSDLNQILDAIELSEKTVRNIRQNLVFAFGYNTLGIPIAAGILYPFFGIVLSPMLASLAMSLSSVSVIGNALRLRRA